MSIITEIFELAGRQYRAHVRSGVLVHMAHRRHSAYRWTRLPLELAKVIWAQRMSWLRENEWSGL